MEQRLITSNRDVTPTPYRSTSTKLVLGLFFAALGILLTLDNFDLLDAHRYLHYAPAVLIVIGLIKVADPTSRGVATVLIVGGSLLLAWSLNWVRFSIFDLWPLMFIIIGFFIVAQALGFRTDTAAGATGSVVKIATVFSNRKETITSRDFKGGRIFSLMGGCELDLTGADIQNGPAIIEVIALMSGIEMRVPEGWDVVGDAMPVMGGIDIRTQSRRGGKQLILRGLVMMAGVEVKDVPVRTT